MDYGVEFDFKHKYWCTPTHYTEVFAAAMKIVFQIFIALWHHS